MAWNPSLDANAVCDEFYQRAYGPAAGERIRKIYHLVDDAVKEFYNADLTANYTATPRFQNDVLAANYPQIESLVDARKAAAEASPAQRARLEFFGDNLVIMRWQLCAAGFLPELKTSPLYRADAEVDKMLGRLHPGFGVELAPGLKRSEKPFLPVSVAWTPALPHARPITPLGLRGQTRFLCFPNADQDISSKSAPWKVCYCFGVSDRRKKESFMRYFDGSVHLFHGTLSIGRMSRTRIQCANWASGAH